MRSAATFVLLAGLLLAACTSSEGVPKAAPRAELRKLGGANIEIVPREGQHPYCLIYTVSATGLVRLLTQTEELESVSCEAGKPVGGVRYHIPFLEGRARIIVIFSDRVVKAGPIAQRISEIAGDGRRMNAFDFRVPGQVAIDELDFMPDAAPASSR